MKVLAFLLLLCVPAQARDLGQWGNNDPAVSQWFRTLMRPDVPTSSCCGEADAYWCDSVSVEGGKTFCTITDDRDDAPLRRPHVDVGTKVPIPDEKLKWDRGNPTGHNIVFLGGGASNYLNYGAGSLGMYVFCFVQGSGT